MQTMLVTGGSAAEAALRSPLARGDVAYSGGGNGECLGGPHDDRGEPYGVNGGRIYAIPWYDVGDCHGES